jgi:hypothetical protein
VFNRANAADITRMKVQSFLSSMKPLKIFTILVGIAWVAFMDTLIVNLFFIASPFFLVSAIIQVLLTKLAIGIYLYQLILIHATDISEPILATQEKLSRLKSSTLWVARLLFLQLPVWTTFYWNNSMLENGNNWLYMLQIIITVSFAWLAIWLFINIKQKNRDKKWFRLIFEGKEWTPVIRSMELLEEISAFKGGLHNKEISDATTK